MNCFAPCKSVHGRFAGLVVCGNCPSLRHDPSFLCHTFAKLTAVPTKTTASTIAAAENKSRSETRNEKNYRPTNPTNPYQTTETKRNYHQHPQIAAPACCQWAESIPRFQRPARHWGSVWWLVKTSGWCRENQLQPDATSSLTGEWHGIAPVGLLEQQTLIIRKKMLWGKSCLLRFSGGESDQHVGLSRKVDQWPIEQPTIRFNSARNNRSIG